MSGGPRDAPIRDAPSGGGDPPDPPDPPTAPPAGTEQVAPEPIVREIDRQTATDIGQRDIQPVPTEDPDRQRFEPTPDAREAEAAAQLDEQVPGVDIGPDDIRPTPGDGFRPSLDTTEDIVAQEFAEDTGLDAGEDFEVRADNTSLDAIAGGASPGYELNITNPQAEADLLRQQARRGEREFDPEDVTVENGEVGIEQGGTGGGGPLDSAIGFVADRAPSPDIPFDGGDVLERSFERTVPLGGDVLTDAASVGASSVERAVGFAQEQTRVERAGIDAIAGVSTDVRDGFQSRVVGPAAETAGDAADIGFTLQSVNPVTQLAAEQTGQSTAAAELDDLGDIDTQDTVGGNAVESAVRGGGDAVSFAIESPAVAQRFGRGAFDIGADVGGELQAGDPGDAAATAADRGGGAAVNAVDRFLVSAGSDPVRTGAALAATGGALGAARSLGPAASTSTRAAIQPGVEAVTFGARQTIGRTQTGRAALNRIPGDALGPEEIVLGSAARAAWGAQRTIDRASDARPSLPSVDTDAIQADVPPSPRQQAQIDAVRDLEAQARVLEADGPPPGALPAIEFRSDVAGLVDSDQFGFQRPTGPGDTAGETATRLDDRQTAEPDADTPPLDEFGVPGDAFPGSEFGSGRPEITPRGQRFGDVAAGPNISFESVADQLPDNLRQLLEDEDAQASLIPTGRQRDPDRNDPAGDARQRQDESESPFTDRGQSAFEEIAGRREDRASGRTDAVESRPLRFGYQRFAADDGPGETLSRVRNPTETLDTDTATDALDRLSAATETRVDEDSETELRELSRATLDTDARDRQRNRTRSRTRTRERTRQRERIRQRVRSRNRTRQRTRFRQRTRTRRRPPSLLTDDDIFRPPETFLESAAGAWRTPVLDAETVAANIGGLEAGSDRSNPGGSDDTSPRAVPDGGRERDLYDEFGFGDEFAGAGDMSGFDALEEDLFGGAGGERRGSGEMTAAGGMAGFDALEEDLFGGGGGLDAGAGRGMGGFGALEEDIAADSGGGLPSAGDLAGGGAFGGGGLDAGLGGGMAGFDALEDDIASGGAFGGGFDAGTDGGMAGLDSLEDDIASGGAFGGGTPSSGSLGGGGAFGGGELPSADELVGGGAFGGGLDADSGAGGGSPLAPDESSLFSGEEGGAFAAMGGLIPTTDSEEKREGEADADGESDAAGAELERADIPDQAAQAVEDARAFEDSDRAREFLDQQVERIEEQEGEEAAEEFKREVNQKLDPDGGSADSNGGLRARVAGAASAAASRVRGALSGSGDNSTDTATDTDDSTGRDPRASSRPSSPDDDDESGAGDDTTGSDPRASSRPSSPDDDDESGAGDDTTGSDPRASSRPQFDDQEEDDEDDEDGGEA